MWGERWPLVEVKGAFLCKTLRYELLTIAFKFIKPKKLYENKIDVLARVSCDVDQNAVIDFLRMTAFTPRMTHVRTVWSPAFFGRRIICRPCTNGSTGEEARVLLGRRLPCRDESKLSATNPIHRVTTSKILLFGCIIFFSLSLLLTTPFTVI